jgi:hypothetical protein
MRLHRFSRVPSDTWWPAFANSGYKISVSLVRELHRSGAFHKGNWDYQESSIKLLNMLNDTFVM